MPGFERIGWPGEYPYTRGLYPTGYRGRTWTIRQFAGFGNARQTNERYRMILGAGGGGLSVAFDMPTLMGRDSDDPQSLGEVGPLRGRDRLRGRHGRAVRRDPAGRRHHQHDDLRSGRADLLHVPGRGRAPGRRSVQTGRHPADGHLQGVHRAEGVAVRARAAPAPDRRPDGVLRRGDSAVQAAVGVGLPHPRGRLDGRAGARVHAGRRVRATSSWACRAGWT